MPWTSGLDASSANAKDRDKRREAHAAATIVLKIRISILTNILGFSHIRTKTSSLPHCEGLRFCGVEEIIRMGLSEDGATGKQLFDQKSSVLRRIAGRQGSPPPELPYHRD